MKNISRKAVNWKVYASILILFYLLLYIVPLSVRPAMMPDETRYAEVPREMMVSGDWITPRLNGLRYFEKPVLGYWVTGISMQLFGDNVFAMRLPSALSAGLSALAIFLLVLRSTRRHSIALCAAMIYLAMLGTFLIGTFNVLDSLFGFLLTAAFVSFYLSHEETDSNKRLFYLLLLGIFCGAAFLVKGFLAYVLLGIVIVPFVILQGRWQDLVTHGWIVLLTSIVIVAPWAIMVQLREPEYWHYFFWEEHIRRFSSDDAQHSEPVWFYLAYLPVMILPWIGMLPFALKNLISGNEKCEITVCKIDSWLQYCILWFLMPFIFFSISRGKLPTYILPCLAPLAVILTIGMEKYMSKIESSIRKNKAYKVTSGLLAIFFITISLALILIQTGVVGKVIWNDNETWKWITLVCVFLSGGLITLYSTRAGSFCNRTSLQAFSFAAIMSVFNMAIPQHTVDSKMPGDFLLSNADRISDKTILVSDESMIHSVNWFYKRDDVFVTGAGELEHGLSFEDSQYRLLEGDDFKKFINEHSGKDEIVVIHHARSYKKMQAIMPEQARLTQQGKFVLWYIPVEAAGSVAKVL